MSLIKRFSLVYRDQKDSRYIREKMSLRHAKDLFESTAKMERELKHLFNGTCKYYCALSILQVGSTGTIFIIAVFTRSVVFFCEWNHSDMNGSISSFSCNS